MFCLQKKMFITFVVSILSYFFVKCTYYLDMKYKRAYINFLNMHNSIIFKIGRLRGLGFKCGHNLSKYE